MGEDTSRSGGLPASAYVQAFAEGRCLELGRGNEEVAFDRAACLDVNAERAAIRTGARPVRGDTCNLVVNASDFEIRDPSGQKFAESAPWI